jgi:hypothetical protein
MFPALGVTVNVFPDCAPQLGFTKVPTGSVNVNVPLGAFVAPVAVVAAVSVTCVPNCTVDVASGVNTGVSVVTVPNFVTLNKNGVTVPSE